MVRGNIWFVQILVALFSRRITASAAVPTALKAVAAFAAARDAAANAPRTTPYDG